MPTPTARDLFLDAIGTIGNLYPAPRTLGRALSLLRDPDSDVTDIATLIGQDPALAADVLRCANSATYGVGVHITAIDQAVQKIGSSETIRILGRVVTHSVTRQQLTNYGIQAEDFWAESLFNGLFMENLARTTRVIDLDEAYVCGLLRFIGRLAINQTMQAFGAGIFWDGSESLSAWEQSNVGVSHAEAGGILLRRWGLAEQVALAVESQDWSESAESPVMLVQALRFAVTVLPSGLNLASLLAPEGRPDAELGQAPFIRDNGITPETVADLIQETQAAFVKVRDEYIG